MTRPTLLLIDDEPALGGFVAHAARDSGYEVVLTSRAEDFRAQYGFHHPSVVTIDLGIPGGDGIEILRFLADQGCTAPIIIISGFDRRVLESAFSLGEGMGLKMIGPLSKPVRLQELKSLLASLL
jgi:DNA-binding response OmpR family regulator